MAYRVMTDDRNRLITVDASPGEDGDVKKLVIDGKWSLPDDRTLKLAVSGNKSYYSGQSVIFRGNVEKATGSSLMFRARVSDTLSGMRTSSIELRGVWRADRRNRLVFRVSKSGGRYDILRLAGEWKVNNNNELIYRYQRTELKTRTKHLSLLVFRGFWDLGEDRIVYRLEGNDDSFFSFRASLQSRSIRAAAGRIKYQIGVGASNRRVYGRRVKAVTLFGKWRLGRDFGVEFELERSGRNRRSIKFSVKKVIAAGRTVTVSLKDSRGESLGLEVSFSRRPAGDIEFFSEFSRSPGEFRVTGGLKGRF